MSADINCPEKVSIDKKPQQKTSLYWLDVCQVAGSGWKVQGGGGQWRGGGGAVAGKAILPTRFPTAALCYV